MGRLAIQGGMTGLFMRPRRAGFRRGNGGGGDCPKRFRKVQERLPNAAPGGGKASFFREMCICG